MYLTNFICRGEQAAMKLHKYFKEREVVKKYWVLTKEIPNPLSGELQHGVILLTTAHYILLF